MRSSLKWFLSFAPVLCGAATFTQQVRTFYSDARSAPDKVRAAFSADPKAASGPGGMTARGGADGLFERKGEGAWVRLFPRQGSRSWAPIDVRAVAYDSGGRLHFASPQGVGVRESGGEWKLFSAEDGLPYDDFTSLAVASDGSVWYGTRLGLVHRIGDRWEYRQGRRWLPSDEVRAVATEGSDVWAATEAGVSKIEHKPMTLADKARVFEDGIDKRHRRTEYQYVLGVRTTNPGDAAEWTQNDSDNDGLWTAMYGAGECFACAATQSAAACDRAKRAFEALRFLRLVTEGGEHPAPRGFVARTVLPASAGNPNAKQYTPEKDRQFRETRDKLWKIMDPRWPLSADGKWYWKADTSSDELDGHYFLYGLYYDLAVKTDADRSTVREHVAAVTDHLIEHGFQLVDHDGRVTRWGVFNPEKLNADLLYWEERSLNSISMLSYLKTAEHITGDTKYARAARELIEKHHYDMNTLIPKNAAGAGAGNQSDDEMAFMCLYNLVRYESDPRLKRMYATALRRRWEMEERELNPLFNYIAAAALRDIEVTDAFERNRLTPEGSWREDSLDTLRRFPLDTFNWALRNSRRKDVAPMPAWVSAGHGGTRGYRRLSGKVLPIDERYVDHWNHDPWQLDYPGDGRHLADGAAYLLPYYMGLYHGFVQD